MPDAHHRPARPASPPLNLVAMHGLALADPRSGPEAVQEARRVVVAYLRSLPATGDAMSRVELLRYAEALAKELGSVQEADRLAARRFNRSARTVRRYRRGR